MKIGIVGAGMVGSSAAYAMTLLGVGTQIVLVDRNEALARAQAGDIAHAAPFGAPVQVKAGGYDGLEGAGVVILAAGVGQKPGESRIALLERNAAVFQTIIAEVTAHAPDAILLIATNPVDVMTYVAQKLSKMPASRVIGSGTILDTARFRAELGSHLGIAPQSVHAYILGEHGDSEIAVWSSATVGSTPVAEFARQIGRPLDAAARTALAIRVRDAAYEIIEGKGATYHGIGAGVARIVQAIIDDERVILSVSTVTPVVEGVQNVPVSLPRIVGREGVIADLMPHLDADEHAGLEASAKVIASLTEALKLPD